MPAQPALEELQWFHITVGRIGGYKGIPVVISRRGYTGELGYEIYCHPNDAKAVFDAVWEEGEPNALTPLGLEGLGMVPLKRAWSSLEMNFAIKQTHLKPVLDSPSH